MEDVSDIAENCRIAYRAFRRKYEREAATLMFQLLLQELVPTLRDKARAIAEATASQCEKELLGASRP